MRELQYIPNAIAFRVLPNVDIVCTMTSEAYALGYCDRRFEVLTVDFRLQTQQGMSGKSLFENA